MKRTTAFVAALSACTSPDGHESEDAPDSGPEPRVDSDDSETWDSAHPGDTGRREPECGDRHGTLSTTSLEPLKVRLRALDRAPLQTRVLDGAGNVNLAVSARDELIWSKPFYLLWVPVARDGVLLDAKTPPALRVDEVYGLGSVMENRDRAGPDDGRIWLLSREDAFDGTFRYVVSGWDRERTGRVTGDDADTRILLPEDTRASQTWMLDVSGDGYEDLVVRKPTPLGHPEGTAALLLFYGPFSGGGFDFARADVTITGADAGFAIDVSGGDMNGDGIEDLIAGTPGREGGSLRLFFGPLVPEVEEADADLTIRDLMSSTWGMQFLTADVDGDGHLDVVVSDKTAPPDETGAVYVFRGPFHPGELTPRDAWATLRGTIPYGEFGKYIATFDLDLDGSSDLIVGEPASDWNQPDISYCDSGLEDTWIYDTSDSRCHDRVVGAMSFWVDVQRGEHTAGEANVRVFGPARGYDAFWVDDLGDYDADGARDLALFTASDGWSWVISPCAADLPVSP